MKKVNFMNIVEAVIARIVRRSTETKNPCKLYKSKEAAEKAVSKLAIEVGQIHQTKLPANYIVFYIDQLGAWSGAIDINEIVSRKEAIGGYVAYAASKGFYTF